MKEDEIKEFLGRMSGGDVIRKVEFSPLVKPSGSTDMKVSLGFIEDIQLDITVELGRATMKVRDILKLEEGSAIELDQPAGETSEVYLNGQRFGKGEVVVIGSSFGIRMESIHLIERRETMGLKQ